MTVLSECRLPRTWWNLRRNDRSLKRFRLEEGRPHPASPRRTGRIVFGALVGDEDMNDNWMFLHVADMQPGSPRSFRFEPAYAENWRTARGQMP
mgnify:CR=1 FL=1